MRNPMEKRTGAEKNTKRRGSNVKKAAKLEAGMLARRKINGMEGENKTQEKREGEIQTTARSRLEGGKIPFCHTIIAVFIPCHLACTCGVTTVATAVAKLMDNK
jgi:hypothetical protein